MAQTRDFVLGMFVGAAVGAAVAILYAPQSGIETRDFVRQKTGELKEKTTTVVDTAKGKVKDVAGTVSSSVKDAAGNVTHSAQSLVDSTKSKVESQVSAVQAAVDAGKQAYQEKRTQLGAEVQEDLNPTPDTTVTGTTSI